MTRRKRVAVQYEGGPLDGARTEMLVGPGTLGVDAEGPEMERHRYALDRATKNPMLLRYQGKVSAGETPIDE